MTRLTVSQAAARWMSRACAEVPPDVFFPVDQAGVLAAQQVCGECPLLRQCARWAPTAHLSDAVVASVLMPACHDTSSASREAANARLAEVERTGKPTGGGGERKRQLVWRSPELQRQVAELRDGEGLKWWQIRQRLGSTQWIVRRAYDAYLEAVA